MYRSLQSFFPSPCWLLMRLKGAGVWFQILLTAPAWLVYLPHAFSSEPSAQSAIPLQNSPFSIHWVSPQARRFSSHTASGVFSRGWTFLSLVNSLQFFTAHFQSQVCFSRSKARPGGQRRACRPWNKKLLQDCKFNQ